MTFPALTILALIIGTAAGQVRYEDILTGPNDNWLIYAGGYSGQRRSTLKQITAENAGSLVPKWTYHMPKANGLRTNPIVHDGIMYVTNSNEVRALHARSGRLVWEDKDPQSKKEAVNRGAAILGDQNAGNNSWPKSTGFGPAAMMTVTLSGLMPETAVICGITRWVKD